MTLLGGMGVQTRAGDKGEQAVTVSHCNCTELKTRLRCRDLLTSSLSRVHCPMSWLGTYPREYCE